MAKELNYKIIDVEPSHCIEGVKSITMQTGEWYTKENSVKITIEFGIALVTSITIKIYKADQVDLILNGENQNEFHESIINKNDNKWSAYEEVEICPSDQQPYYQLQLIVTNYDGKEYKGLRRVRIYGIQDETIKQQIIQQIKQDKKDKKDVQKQKNQDNTQSSLKIQQPKNNDQWKTYNKQPIQQNKDIKLITIDPREKLRNIHKSPSPRKEEKQKIDEESNNKRQYILIENEEDKAGQYIDDRKMTRYNFKEIDETFLILHTQLQLSSGIQKERMLNQTNLEKYWLK